MYNFNGGAGVVIRSDFDDDDVIGEIFSLTTPQAYGSVVRQISYEDGLKLCKELERIHHKYTFFLMKFENNANNLVKNLMEILNLIEIIG